MESPAIPPFRNEQRWGNVFENSFDGIGGTKPTGQLISVNETPTRVWDLLLLIEPTPVALATTTTVIGRFDVRVGVGSTVSLFRRVLTMSGALVPPPDSEEWFTGVTESLVLPASSFVVNCEVLLLLAGPQPFPFTVRFGAFASPRVPFLAPLESAAWLLEDG